MKVMVTGGGGFIGSHVVDMLVAAGYRVSVVDDLSTGRFENINPGANFYRVKIEDDDFGRVVERERPDVVIHHAAQVDVVRSLQEPLQDARINVLGAVNLLENCWRYRVGKVIYASSAAVYGDPVYLPVDEAHPVVPQSPYGVSKYTVEHYLRVYQELYGVRFTVLRYANVFGPRQNADGEGGVVAIFIDRLLKDKRVKIFGDGRQTRDFVYVGDVACANLAALERGDSEVLNISTGASLSVIDLFQLLKGLTGSSLEPEYCPPRPGDILHSCLANERAREVLGWSPRSTVEEGLRRTLDYYYNHNLTLRVSN
ncbi:MAG TPA: NAD-dependent epimerase/dehydratase family protein [Bacillota bacterium]|nr:NAD-dependent epimerase/dehydratase family protein [Peptococcaceae bacterium]HPU36343.1 NAD-dependent epimerase/dehydratase family protein [Bacillota bacterium]HPZ43187.1 NAD-dependent epimerase/dehydratase family protein [Bacillota bacterium]HQD75712.1 NAD-dependent epimerase/dehydratase family protein [Bacillota bacterium]HUM58568.1 NAD-dependent epimerase/dehydratase family protein [Bacillota bacterium]